MRKFTVIIETESNIDDDPNFPSAHVLEGHLQSACKEYERVGFEVPAFNVKSIKVLPTAIPKKPPTIKQQIAALNKQRNRLNPHDPSAHVDRMAITNQIQILQHNCIHSYNKAGTCTKCDISRYD